MLVLNHHNFFFQMDFTNASIALNTAEQVKQMTADGRKIKDPEVVVFIGKMFDTLSNYWNRGVGIFSFL